MQFRVKWIKETSDHAVKSHQWNYCRRRWHSKRSDMDHTVLPANDTMPAFPS